MVVAGVIVSILAGVGMLQCVLGAIAARRFARRSPLQPRAFPAVTVLKPLHGDEPLLEDALASVCRQDYPTFHIICGVQDAADPAVRVVRRLQSRFAGLDLELVIDRTRHGANLKVGNLINMARAARSEIIVIADSDVICPPDYLRLIVAALEPADVGLITTLYAGLPARSDLIGLLGASSITFDFLPGALLARLVGRQDCLGATMALRRQTLAAIGGLAALSDHLADDNRLGRLVGEQGLAVRLAQTVPLTVVGESTFGDLFRHELRWARTIRALAPAAFAASILRFPIAWSALAVAVTAGAPWAWAVLLLAWAVRSLAASVLGRSLTPVVPQPFSALGAATIWLLPIRELMSVAVMAASYAGTDVRWRGYRMRADRAAV